MSDWMTVAFPAGAVLACVLVCIGMWFHTRRKYVGFTGNVLAAIQTLEDGEPLGEQDLNEDSLEGKIFTELSKLGKIYHSANDSSTAQKREIQQMVSDISHQLKTPIANIVMYNDIVLNNSLEGEEEKKYLEVTKQQVEKLNFLVQALVKMSRVESAMIVLQPRRENLFQCIGQALAGISRSAEAKRLHVEVDCPERLSLAFDPKWTAEAIGNVLDNAVKYTPEDGHIWIKVVQLELFTRIDISDDGIGIEEKHYPDVFKRFWRDEKVHDRAGVGIGLYLTREIITRQGGYVKVKSEPGQGSCFSLYIPN